MLSAAAGARQAARHAATVENLIAATNGWFGNGAEVLEGTGADDA